ncbi:hypothetical protein JWG41_18195 [Leptospira sp. 201903075]|uniref:hypothetical protein n=1 Tax=Leptospira chreensis TaxID=2810035 RepID=UPI0019637AFF|nr:hypothetical protein [Leptospira chreensis]MBM9592380.1 hypothetical protein [Leptospira chreensis]
MISKEELRALNLIFAGENEFCFEVRNKINSAQVIDRIDTGVGFTSLIHLTEKLSKMPNVLMWQFAFDHPSFPEGGSFMCMVLSEEELELEGVALGGKDWPVGYNLDLFREQEYF